MILFLLLLPLISAFCTIDLPPDQGIVKSTKRIDLKNFPNAYNPSLFKLDDRFLLTFRYIGSGEPNWVSYVGIVLLNQDGEPLSEPELLNTRTTHSKTPSQAEDARIFAFRNRLFLIYNDNVDVSNPGYADRRDMFMAELSYRGGHFALSPPLKLTYPAKYPTVLWQKNWVPFDYHKQLLLIYSIDPHEILSANLLQGLCYSSYLTSPDINWYYGALRGSTPPQLFDGEYLAFFHSGCVIASKASSNEEIWHYFMGAYTFSAEPPFKITAMTPLPIVGKDFYTPSDAEKRVIFPGGFVVSDDTIYVAYGKDDREIWIATLDKQALKQALVPIKPTQK